MPNIPVSVFPVLNKSKHQNEDIFLRMIKFGKLMSDCPMDLIKIDPYIKDSILRENFIDSIQMWFLSLNNLLNEITSGLFCDVINWLKAETNQLQKLWCRRRPRQGRPRGWFREWEVLWRNSRCPRDASVDAEVAWFVEGKGRSQMTSHYFKMILTSNLVIY